MINNIIFFLSYFLFQGQPFTFQVAIGPCNWVHYRKKLWTQEDIEWIKEMDVLMTAIFGVDYPRYVYQKQQDLNGNIRNGSCIVKAEDIPSYRYIHSQWEDAYPKEQDCNSSASPPRNSTSPQHGSSSLPRVSVSPSQSTSPPSGTTGAYHVKKM